MSYNEIKVFEEALQLPPETRAALAGKLIESLDQEADADAESAWAEEVERRVQELDGGMVRVVPWNKARRTILGD